MGQELVHIGQTPSRSWLSLRRASPTRWCSCADRPCECGRGSILQDQLTIPELVTGQQQPQLVGCVEAAPVQTQPQHQLEHQVKRVLPNTQSLAGVRAQPRSGKDRLERVACAQVHPMFFWEVIEGDEILPVTLQAGD